MMNLDDIKAGKEVDIFLQQDIGNGLLRFTDYEDASCAGDICIGKGKAIFDLETDEQVLNNALSCIDDQIKMVRAEAHAKVVKLQERKADLLALTHQQ